MPNRFKILFLATMLVATLSLPAAVLAEHRDGSLSGHPEHKSMSHGKDGMGSKYGHRMHGSMMGMHGIDLPHGIELSDAQQAEVTRLRREMRDRHHEAMGKIMREMDRLHDLYAADTLDPKAIGEAHERIFKLRRPLFEAAANSRNRLRTILTPEQRELMGRKGRGTCPLHDPHH